MPLEYLSNGHRLLCVARPLILMQKGAGGEQPEVLGVVATHAGLVTPETQLRSPWDKHPVRL